MATEKPESKRKGGGGKLARSVIVTVRMDAQLNYLADLAARKQRRTLSSFIEWAVQQSFGELTLREGSGYNGEDSVSLKDMEKSLWDVDESERFARLAIHFPELLTHEEQERWKLLTDSKLLSPAMQRNNGNRTWDWAKLEDVVFPELRGVWASLLVAQEAGPEAARKWVSATQTNVSTICKGGTPSMPTPQPVSARPAPVAAPISPPPVVATAKPKPASGFDDMDDDIPF